MALARLVLVTILLQSFQGVKFSFTDHCRRFSFIDDVVRSDRRIGEAFDVDGEMDL